MNEGKYNYYGEKWEPKHRCSQKRNPQKIYMCEAESEVDSNSEGSSEDDARNHQTIPQK